MQFCWGTLSSQLACCAAVCLLGQQARKEQQDGLGLSLPSGLGEEAGSHKGQQQGGNRHQHPEGRTASILNYLGLSNQSQLRVASTWVNLGSTWPSGLSSHPAEGLVKGMEGKGTDRQT